MQQNLFVTMLHTIITFLTIVSCYSTRLLPLNVDDITDVPKQKVYSLSNSFIRRNSTSPRSELTLTANITSAHTRQQQNWQVERVTKKQYEIINMLWRKTKIFVNFENTTPEERKRNITESFHLVQRKNPIRFTTRPPILQSITPSYIEFYYLDESGESVENKRCLNAKCQLKNDEKSNTNMISSPNSSFLLIHMKGSLKSSTRTTINDHSTSQSPFKIPRSSIDYTNKPSIRIFKTIPYTNRHLDALKLTSNEESVKMSTSTEATTTEKNNSNNKTLKTESTPNISDFTRTQHQTESTTVYDKIKFFELYDKHTRVPFTKKVNILKYNFNESADEEIEIDNAQKILLEDVDQSSHEHNEAKHSKKHIVGNDKNLSQSCMINIIKENTKPKVTERQNDTTSNVANGIVKSESKESKNVFSYINKPVSWTKYPFAAVYVYEPSQVHCEAASISPHWLVASGSCLFRLNQNPELGDGRSAFVAYCGEKWWHPERVSYVKYSVVHPWYHPRDRTRKLLYNIGVIQVVTSMMSACSEWAPVSLMSHQFSTIQGGSEALALGWGLDRYDTRYAAMDLPKASLMIYKGLAFSDSCPGNIGYGVKQVDERGGLKNVYCLLLPPYAGEERDPVHGSLLLVGDKLIALYLEEERRSWGEQSAQYTGIWHLIPWVAEVAKEPEEIELFSVEI